MADILPIFFSDSRNNAQVGYIIEENGHILIDITNEMLSSELRDCLTNDRATTLKFIYEEAASPGPKPTHWVVSITTCRKWSSSPTNSMHVATHGVTVCALRHIFLARAFERPSIDRVTEGIIMSETDRNYQRDRDWWAKRPLSGLAHPSGRIRPWKKLLHKRERRVDKSELVSLCASCDGSGVDSECDLLFCLDCNGSGENPI